MIRSLTLAVLYRNSADANMRARRGPSRLTFIGADAVWESGTGVPPVKSRARCTCHNQTASVPVSNRCLILVSVIYNARNRSFIPAEELIMSRVLLGTICGVVYGALSAASMIPLTFPDKRAALLGAFINRFSIGFVIGAVTLPWPGWLSGLVLGLLLSLADAVITKAYVPIIVLGAVG